MTPVASPHTASIVNAAPLPHPTETAGALAPTTPALSPTEPAATSVALPLRAGPVPQQAAAIFNAAPLPHPTETARALPPKTLALSRTEPVVAAVALPSRTPLAAPHVAFLVNAAPLSHPTETAGALPPKALALSQIGPSITSVALPPLTPPARPHAASTMKALPVPLPSPPAPDFAASVLPSSTPLRLRIAYNPAAPTAALAAGQLGQQLQRDLGDVATADVVPEPVRSEKVLYFFANDRDAATRVADRLTYITNRPAVVELVHVKPPPPPGTVEIRLPLMHERT
jgi:hypothetical protein